MLWGRPVDLLLGMEDLQRKNREAVDDEAGGLRVEGSGRILWGDLKQCRIDLFDEIVAKLV